MSIFKRRNRKAFSFLSLMLIAALAFGLLPTPARAATSAEIQKEIDAL